MNINIIKDKISSRIGSKVIITVYGIRNKISNFDGVIKSVYPNIFTVETTDGEKSFNYRDIVTKDISVKYYE